MQVKVYEAQDMRSALKKVKNELGPDALILSSRNIYKNKLGVLGKPWIEVVAAVDGSMETEKNNSVRENGPFKDVNIGGFPNESQDKNGTYTKDGSFKELLAKREVIENNYKDPLAAGGAERPAHNESVIREMRQLKQSFQGLTHEISEMKSHWEKQLRFSRPDFKCHDFDSNESEKKLLPELDGLGLRPETIQVLLEMIEKKKSDTQKKDTESRGNLLEQIIAEVIKIVNPLSGPWTSQKRISFIGPTGVGKTTTIAKVAANYLINCGKKVALATIDNYRIAAVEQLKIYGQIMNIPVETANSPQRLKNIFDRHQDKDLILVDTAGRSPKDELSLQELACFLDPALQIENHLVLSATTRESDLYSVIKRFRNIELHGLVFTKLDECDLLGSILNVQLQAGYPVSFLTNGQKVPEDLLPHEPHHIARMILCRNEVAEI
jgi:flagellar biosynthesis protein FlhF